MMSRPRPLLALFFVGLLGCGSEDEGATAVARAKLAEGCVLGTDCAAPLVCAFGRCHEECTDNRDCVAPARCVRGAGGGVCQLEDERTCTRNTDCGEPLVCGPDDQCRDECRFDRDCFGGLVCRQGVCATTSELGLTGRLVSKAPGVPCAGSTDCPAGLVCRSGACAFECKETRDCPDDFVCKDGGCSPEAITAPVCIPGNQRACACPAGGLGVTFCKSDGTGFDEACGGCEVGTGGVAGAGGQGGETPGGAGGGDSGGGGQGGEGGGGQGGAGGQSGGPSGGQGGGGQPACGNGSIEPGETCDGAVPSGQTCVTAKGAGYVGALACVACQLDVSACTLCGNGAKDAGEDCDGLALGGATCASLIGDPLATGEPACTAACTLSTASCSAPGCGNGQLDPGEMCDGALLGERTCVSEKGQGNGGHVLCAADCKSVDTTKCAPGCGNGTVDGDEECDYTRPPETCADIGLIGGQVFCRPDCTRETSLCIAASSLRQPLPAPVAGIFTLAMAGNGGSIVFSTQNDAMDVNDVDANGKSDVFAFDLSFAKKSTKLRRVSVSASGGDADGDSEVIDASYDGNKVLFRSKASNLVTGKGIVAGGSAWHLYLRDLGAGTTSLLDVTTAGQASTTGVVDASLAEDGGFVAFTSLAPGLVAGGAASPVAVPFVRTIATSVTERLPTGKASSFTADAARIRISADGRYVFFDTKQRDVTDQQGVLRFDRQSKTYFDVTAAADPPLELALDQQTQLMGISADGSLVTFAYAEDPTFAPGQALWLFDASAQKAEPRGISAICLDGGEGTCSSASEENDEPLSTANTVVARDGRTVLRKQLDPVTLDRELVLHEGTTTAPLLTTDQGGSIGSLGPAAFTVTKENKRVFAVRSAVSVLSNDPNPLLPDVYVF